jgi:hypothetical protein
VAAQFKRENKTMQLTPQLSQFDPLCMLALQVIIRAKLDAQKGDCEARQWFKSRDYHWYLDFISVHTGCNLPYDFVPNFGGD